MGSKFQNKVGAKERWVFLKNRLDLKNGYNVGNFSANKNNLNNYVETKPKGTQYEKPETDMRHRYYPFPPEEKPVRKIGCCTKVLFYCCLILLPIATTMTIISFSTPYWFYSNTGSTSVGLFQSCTGGQVTCTSVFSVLSADVLIGTWIYVIIFHAVGLFFLLNTVIFLMCIYIHRSIRTAGSVAVGVVTAVFILLGSACILVGVFFMVNFYVHNSGYMYSISFYLAAVGGGLGCLVFFLLLTHILLVACECDLD